MAKKKDDGAPDDAAIARQKEEREHERRKSVAVRQRVISQEPCSSNHAVEPSRHLFSLNASNIIKKGSARKHLFLFALPALLCPGNLNTDTLKVSKPVSSTNENVDPADEEDCKNLDMEGLVNQIGVLDALDTSNPVLYLNFHLPNNPGQIGRLKLFGTMVYPKAKVITLKPRAIKGASRSKENTAPSVELSCESVFESAVIFSEPTWIGCKEDNPTEDCLPLPDWLFKSAPPPVTLDAFNGLYSKGKGILAKALDVDIDPQGADVEDVVSDVCDDHSDDNDESENIINNTRVLNRPIRQSRLSVKSYRDSDNDDLDDSSPNSPKKSVKRQCITLESD